MRYMLLTVISEYWLGHEYKILVTFQFPLVHLVANSYKVLCCLLKKKSAHFELLQLMWLTNWPYFTITNGEMIGCTRVGIQCVVVRIDDEYGFSVCLKYSIYSISCKQCELWFIFGSHKSFCGLHVYSGLQILGIYFE